MGSRNPPVPWQELEARLSGRTRPFPAEGDGGDSPAWSYHRQPYQPPERPQAAPPGPGRRPYAELHCHSNFSFLDGASHPEELVEEAARLGLTALALTDHDGMYGVVRFAEAAAAVGLPTVFGAELTLGLVPPPKRRRRPRRHPPGRAGPRRHRLRPAVPGHLHRPDGGPGEGQAPDRPGDPGRHRRRRPAPPFSGPLPHRPIIALKTCSPPSVEHEPGRHPADDRGRPHRGPATGTPTTG